MATTSEDTAKNKASKKYVPKPEGLNLEFHQICVATGLLHLQQCQDCSTFRHTPRWYCPNCHSANYAFTPISGQGEIYSMAINHYTVDRGWSGEVPFITAVVQVLEGPRVVGSLQGVRTADGGLKRVELGSPVQVSLEPRGEDFAFLTVELVDRP